MRFARRTWGLVRHVLLSLLRIRCPSRTCGGTTGRCEMKALNNNHFLH